MKLPTHEQTIAYFDTYFVPINIRKHCFLVNKLANSIAVKANLHGLQVNEELIDRLSLLHDIFKMVAIEKFGHGVHDGAPITEKEIEFWQDFKKKYAYKYEGQVAKEIFKDEFPEMANSLARVSNPYIDDHTIEEKIVHYADWRVLQEKIVSLTVRVAYLKERYPNADEHWDQQENKIQLIEKELEQKLNLTTQEMGELL